MRSIPDGNTATVLPPALNAASCAMPSMPSANPLTIANPDSAAAVANSLAARQPSREGFRVPTIDKVVAPRCAKTPRQNKKGGRSVHWASNGGYSGSWGVTKQSGTSPIRPAGTSTVVGLSNAHCSHSSPSAFAGSAAQSNIASGEGHTCNTVSNQRALFSMARVSVSQRASASSFIPNWCATAHPVGAWP